jgi:hypothetical protein
MVEKQNTQCTQKTQTISISIDRYRIFLKISPLSIEEAYSFYNRSRGMWTLFTPYHRLLMFSQASNQKYH